MYEKHWGGGGGWIIDPNFQLVVFSQHFKHFNRKSGAIKRHRFRNTTKSQ